VHASGHVIPELQTLLGIRASFGPKLINGVEDPSATIV
jgi:hypothetical protein